MCAKERPGPQTRASFLDLFKAKPGWEAFLSLPFVLSPGGIASQKVPVCYSLVVLHGCRPSWLLELTIWMPIPQGEVLEVETLDAGFRAFAVREKLGVVSSLLFVYHCARGGGYGESISAFPVWMQVYLIC